MSQVGPINGWRRDDRSWGGAKLSVASSVVVWLPHRTSAFMLFSIDGEIIAATRRYKIWSGWSGCWWIRRKKGSQTWCYMISVGSLTRAVRPSQVCWWCKTTIQQKLLCNAQLEKDGDDLASWLEKYGEELEEDGAKLDETEELVDCAVDDMVIVGGGFEWHFDEVIVIDEWHFEGAKLDEWHFDDEDIVIDDGVKLYEWPAEDVDIEHPADRCIKRLNKIFNTKLPKKHEGGGWTHHGSEGGVWSLIQ